MDCVYKKQKETAINTFIFTFLKEVCKMASCSQTQNSSAQKTNLQAFKDSKCILHFTRIVLTLTPQFLSSINGSGIGLGLQISPQKQTERFEVKRVCTVENWSFTSITNPVFRFIFRQPLTHFTICSVVQHPLAKGNVKLNIQ
jgi:hypothetical protein